MQILFCFIFPSAQSIILPSGATVVGENCDSLVSMQRLTHTTEACLKMSQCRIFKGAQIVFMHELTSFELEDAESCDGITVLPDHMY